MSSADDQVCDDDSEKIDCISSKRLGKRKQHGKPDCDELKSKLQNCDVDNVFKLPFSTPKKSIENPIKTSTERINSSMDPEEISEVLDGMDEEIDHVLVETANKNKLTARNVKNILRHVITNEYVLAMVRNTMKLENSEVDDLDEAPFEPKLTRSKAKELREKQRILPWPVSSPMKQPDVASKQLLEAEFSEESSDEDYKPTEEEVPSEEDEGASSPKSGACESSICESPAVPTVTKLNEEFGDEENNLIIVFDDPEKPSDVSEADKIALRTRSKLCLNATSLEDIEASYVAPDITMDMYDTTCDDEEWQKFLQAVFKSTDSSLPTEVPVEETDDAEDDPEYNVLEDDDMPDEFDLRYDKAVKIPRKELNALMEEILEFDYQGMPDCDEEEDLDISFSENNRTDTPCIPALPVENDFVENFYSQWMTAEERMLLDEQMRMYVQLLAQSFLLSVGIPELNFLSISTKLFLDEIKMFASKEMTSGVKSAFYSHNLDGALNIVNEYENEQYSFHRQASMIQRPLSIGPTRIKKTLASNEVFMYPELLPICSFHIKFERRKTSFTEGEDNLIALGLEQFSSTSCPVYNIMTLMMPAKTERQIKIRIKNSRCHKMSLSNPIKFYHVYKVAPTFPRIIRLFDPEKVKAPKDLPPEILPAWMKPFCTTVTPIAPAAEKNSLNAPTFDTPPPSKRKYCPILPRGLHFSPLKQISPILKKYSQQRRSVSMVPFNSASPCKRKCTTFVKKPNNKPLPIKPKPVAVDIKQELPSHDLKSVPSTATASNFKKEMKQVNNQQSNKEPNLVCSSVNKSFSNKVATQTKLRAPVNELNASLAPSVSKSNEAEAEICDEVDEEAIDDEQDLVALMAASTTICKKQQSTSKKRNRLQRDLESSLALLQPNLIENDPKREEREALFANSYLLRVTEALKADPETCEMFLKALCKYQHSAKSPVKLYFELQDILKNYPGLADDFIAFLSPEQAKVCGKYKEFTMLRKVREFLRKVEIHFSNQPQHLVRILRTFGQLRLQKGITSAEVINALQSLLRNQSHLMEELSSLLPDTPPPE
ncbi:GON-4-like protein [Uloborus diversus]|uniref:GON-4-like protein n=1 Tax=Uloborus diversus TaxID=327109 RepID=UPI002409C063|nr:GON-4-like protein [Uloborus diversus]